MNIVKTAIKLNRFKNLLATTVATSLFFSPVAATFFLLSLKSVPADSGLATGIILGGGVLQTIFAFVCMDRIMEHKTKIAFFSSFWKKVFDTPLKFLKRQENEKIILALRGLPPANQTLDEAQKNYLASIYVEAKIQEPQELRWRHMVEATDKHVLGPDFLSFTKQQMVIDKLNAIFHYSSAINISLEPFVSKKLQEYLNKNPGESFLFISSWAQELEKARVSDKYNSPEEQIASAYKDRAQFLFRHSYSLCEKDYLELEKLFKKEKSHLLSSIVGFLTHNPQSVATTNWVRIEQFMEGYKAEDEFFKSYHKQIQKLARATHSQIEQKTVVDKVSQHTKELTHGTGATVKPDTLSTPALASEKDIKEYLNFIPTHFQDKWGEIKQGYEFIQSHKSELDPIEVIAFMTSLQGSLGVLITSDQAVGRLPTTPIDYRAKAKKLLEENLDLTLEQIYHFQSVVSEKHIKTLEIHKNYQTAKMSK